MIIIITVLFIILIAIVTSADKCLHCGSKRGTFYCEKCYQLLVAENSRLQLEIKELEKAKNTGKN